MWVSSRDEKRTGTADLLGGKRVARKGGVAFDS